MKIIKHINGKSISINLFKYTLSINKVYRLPLNENRKVFLFQFNRFENGYIDIYFRFLYRYSITLDGIKVKAGKRIFIGQREN